MEFLLVSVTIASLTLAVVMSAVAWSLMRRRRSADDRGAATLENQAGPIDREDLDDPGTNTRADASWDLALRNRHDAPISSAARWERDAGSQAPSPLIGRRWLGAAALVLLAVATIAAISALRSPEIVAALAASRGEGQARPTPGSRSLELLSLRHSREPDGAFRVTGLVRNPDSGRELQNIEAVIYLFDGDGLYFASGRSALGAQALAPGDETPFVVRIEGESSISRYRVGFRFPDGTAVAHLDHRAPAGVPSSAGAPDRLEGPAAAAAIRPAPSDQSHR